MRRLMVFICAVGAFASAAPRPPAETSRITQEELVRRTQELFDAVAGGNQVPWKKYLADDCVYFDENGQSRPPQRPHAAAQRLFRQHQDCPRAKPCGGEYGHSEL